MSGAVDYLDDLFRREGETKVYARDMGGNTVLAMLDAHLHELQHSRNIFAGTRGCLD